MPLNTFVVHPLFAASSQGGVVRARNQWSTGEACETQEKVLRGAVLDLSSTSNFFHKDRFLALVLLKAMSVVYNKVYNGLGGPVKTYEKTSGCHE